MIETKIVEEKEIVPDEGELILSEMRQPIWSVISFEKSVKSGMTYDEALKMMKKLKTEKVSGLCIVTDEAASRI
jgi:hypothetical protein